MKKPRTKELYDFLKPYNRKARRELIVAATMKMVEEGKLTNDEARELLNGIEQILNELEN